MDSLQNRPTDWSSAQPSFSPLQERLNATPGISGALMLPPPVQSAPGHPLPSLNELADLESMLLWTLHEPSTIALMLMYCLSFVLGFVGNLMSLRVLTNRRSRRLAGISATRTLLVNLAVCDLAVVCVCMPITLANQIYTAWVYGDLLCRAVPFTQAVSVSASVLTLTVISVNRYYSVRSPLRARSMFTRRRILATVGVVWAVSSLICAPIAVMNRRREISFGKFAILVCQEEWPKPRLKQGYNVLLFTMLYCLPVTFNLNLGFLTGRRLWAGKKSAFADLDPRSRALHASRLKTRQKIAKMVVCLVLLFAASWLPLYLADLWIDREQRPPSWLLQTRPFAQWLGLTNSSLNPICYCFIGDLYRSARVIRTRYYQKVATLFGTTSFSSSVSPAAAVPVISVGADSKAGASERGHIAAVAVSASMATIPRLLSLAQGRGPARFGSEHSISDWCRSSPSVGDSSALFPCPVRTPDPAAQKQDFLPARRHSANENFGTLPTRAGQDAAPARRHSGGRLSAECGDNREIISGGFCYDGRRSSKTSRSGRKESGDTSGV
ncbi:neuropeptide Y receptor type 2-like [Nerophis lumbriciformis]|uniref:neuropeptide Y receptor type 2-like n=1 Tax=Nerophis lumbriciformis TaxID=546530 RepID=UPI002ADF4546|nr:neuropeptide FF receptor 2-like [Nerophis lumbriciformis]